MSVVIRMCLQWKYLKHILKRKTKYLCKCSQRVLITMQTFLLLLKTATTTKKYLWNIPGCKHKNYNEQNLSTRESHLLN